MPPTKIAVTAAEFLDERKDFLFIYHAPSSSGRGWDVVMRIDGTYRNEDDASHAAAVFRLDYRLSDVPEEGRDWWHGPPHMK